MKRPIFDDDWLDANKLQSEMSDNLTERPCFKVYVDGKPYEKVVAVNLKTMNEIVYIPTYLDENGLKHIKYNSDKSLCFERVFGKVTMLQINPVLGGKKECRQ